MTRSDLESRRRLRLWRLWKLFSGGNAPLFDMNDVFDYGVTQLIAYWKQASTD